ncbi:MAG TPA: hypothetical protein VGB37_07405 [Candidatus Lokiarchaeia archaeon]
MKTLKQVKYLCNKWCKIFNIPKFDVFVVKKLKTGYTACYSRSENCMIFTKNSLKYNDDAFYPMLFHELGHAKYKMPPYTFSQKVNSEKMAEKFSFKNLKKYFPEHYKKAIVERKKLIKIIKENRKLYKKYKYYYYAFKQIKELQ